MPPAAHPLLDTIVVGDDEDDYDVSDVVVQAVQDQLKKLSVSSCSPPIKPQHPAMHHQHTDLLDDMLLLTVLPHTILREESSKHDDDSSSSSNSSDASESESSLSITTNTAGVRNDSTTTMDSSDVTVTATTDFSSSSSTDEPIVEKKKKKKAVRFHKTNAVHVVETIHVFDYTCQELAATFYNATEMRRFRRERRDLARLLDRGFLPEDIEERSQSEYCVRGIEMASTEGHRRRHDRIAQGIHSVMMEQDMQYEDCHRWDSQAIASVYQRAASEQSSQEALQRGLQDEEQVMDDLERIRQAYKYWHWQQQQKLTTSRQSSTDGNNNTMMKPSSMRKQERDVSSLEL